MSWALWAMPGLALVLIALALVLNLRTIRRQQRVAALLAEVRAALNAHVLAQGERVELLVLRDARKTLLAMADVEFTAKGRELLAAVPTMEGDEDGAGRDTHGVSGGWEATRTRQWARMTCT